MKDLNKTYIYTGEDLVVAPNTCRYYRDDNNIKDIEAPMPKYDKIIPKDYFTDYQIYVILHIKSGILFHMGHHHFNPYTKLAGTHRKKVLDEYKSR